jgi:hypothetical protein
MLSVITLTPCSPSFCIFQLPDQRPSLVLSTHQCSRHITLFFPQPRQFLLLLVQLLLHIFMLL